MPPWVEVLLAAGTPVVVGVVLLIVGRVVSTSDYHAEDGRVSAETLHQIRKDTVDRG